MTWKAYYRSTAHELQPGDSIRFVSGRTAKFHGVTEDGKNIKVGPLLEDVKPLNCFPDVTVKRPLGTIDMTPTWTAILPILFAALENGTDTGKALAKEEIRRMAQAADAYNAQVKP